MFLGRRQPAHVAHPPRPRHRAHAAEVQPHGIAAERIATLDLVSDGRVDFGTGETSSQAELEGFGIERTEKREQWDEALDAVTRMFVESPFAGYEGRYITMPVREVLPKTLQKPHPPLWVRSRRDTIHLAATKGIGALTFSFVEPDEARMWVDDYDTIASEACVPAGFAVNPNLAVVLPMMCHQDEQTAIDRGLDGGHFFGYSLGHWYVFGEHTLGRTSVYEQFEKNRDLFGFRRQTAAQTGQARPAVRTGHARQARWAPPTSPRPRAPTRRSASTRSSSCRRRATIATSTSASRWSCSPATR